MCIVKEISSYYLVKSYYFYPYFFTRPHLKVNAIVKVLKLKCILWRWNGLGNILRENVKNSQINSIS